MEKNRIKSGKKLKKVYIISILLIGASLLRSDCAQSAITNVKKCRFFKNEDNITEPCLFSLSKLQYAIFSEKLTDGAPGKWHFSIGVHSL